MIINYINSKYVSFHVPGHGSGNLIPEDISIALGKKAFYSDLTELSGLDNLHHPEGAIKQAQYLAADAFGVRWTHFLVGGSSAGIKAMILSCLSPGDRMLVARDCHKSVISGFIMGGVEPVFVYGSSNNIHYPVSSLDYIEALNENNSLNSVLVTAPNYYGMMVDIQAISDIARKKNITIMVDEAHGSHLNWCDKLPKSAVSMDVDLVVHSAHKTLPALTQGSYLHVVGNGSYTSRLLSVLSLLQTSSPSYPIMASLDACRKFVYFSGEKYLNRTLEIAKWLRREINGIDGLKSPDRNQAIGNGVYDFDETKLYIDVSDIGLNGFTADEFLRSKGIFVEMVDFHGVLCVLTMSTRWVDAQKLIKALKELKRQADRNKEMHRIIIPSTRPPKTTLNMLPRDAFFAQNETVPLAEAVGRISAISVSPYPPGIPALIPGEVITKEIIEYLLAVLRMGSLVEGVFNSRIRVIR